MTLSAIFVGLGRERFDDLLGRISMGSLRTYKLYETFKFRARLLKLGREKLRRAAPKLWERLEQGDENLARETAQAVLVSHLDFVVKALDALGIPHDGNGFFDKDAQAEDLLQDGWQKKLLTELQPEWPESLILLYINHLDWELGKPEEVFLG
ncbi:MAG: hypothetical protein GC160_16580 [Acidobacteria bacterium]|nr:hypothetical protein [Acidobacteriota bacterium]